MRGAVCVWSYVHVELRKGARVRMGRTYDTSARGKHAQPPNAPFPIHRLPRRSKPPACCCCFGRPHGVSVRLVAMRCPNHHAHARYHASLPCLSRRSIGGDGTRSFATREPQEEATEQREDSVRLAGASGCGGDGTRSFGLRPFATRDREPQERWPPEQC